MYPNIVDMNAHFRTYAIVYFVINFVLFFVGNTWIEASLVLKTRKEIAEKRARLEEEIRVSTANNSSHSKVVDQVIRGKQKKVEEDAVKDRRVVKMVIINSLLNFFLRLPEILVFLSSNSSFIQFTLLRMIAENYLTNELSSLLVGISYFLYICTFTSNVIIICSFNMNFKQLFISGKK
jgi:hypothetical protein